MKLLELIGNEKRGYKQKIKRYARSLAGKRIRLITMNEHGADFDRDITVAMAAFSDETEKFSPLFIIIDRDREAYCIWKDSKITALA